MTIILFFRGFDKCKLLILASVMYNNQGRMTRNDYFTFEVLSIGIKIFFILYCNYNVIIV